MKEDTQLLFTKLLDINNNNTRSFKPIVLSKEGTQLIKHLFNKLHATNNDWESHKPSIQIETLSELPKSTDFAYIPLKIKTEIENDCIHLYSCSFTFKQRIFTVYLCLKSAQPKYIIGLIRRIYLWLSIASEHVQKNCSNTVNIYLYLIGKKKEIPFKSAEAIDLIHVNTAFTTGCQLHTNVHIFREEEWFRALIHESFHNLGFDFLQLETKLQNEAEKKIRNIFPVKMREIRFNETYCEMWAEVLNIIFIVYLSDIPSLSLKNPTLKMMNTFKQMLLYEGMFSLWQCVKVLNHNNLVYSQLYNESLASTYREKTQGFSYYILKSIYMVHVSQFLHHCATQASTSPFKFGLSSDSIQSYTGIIEKNHNSYNMREGIQIFEKEIVLAKGFWKNTLRMSLFEGTVV